MSLIGVYPDINLMTEDQLKKFILHLEVQLIESENKISETWIINELEFIEKNIQKCEERRGSHFQATFEKLSAYYQGRRDAIEQIKGMLGYGRGL